jgi:hypothetical protein
MLETDRCHFFSPSANADAAAGSPSPLFQAGPAKAELRREFHEIEKKNRHSEQQKWRVYQGDDRGTSDLGEK